jgi:hypothetical protein
MNVQRMYEATLRHKSDRAVSLHYKVNKALVNAFYPLFGRCGRGVDDKSNVIISLTSYPARIGTVHLTVMTLLNQTVKPKAVVLWLAKEQFPEEEGSLPDKLLKLRNFGLQIRFCEDLRPHKKYYYSMKENPECYVITADDDVFYPENLVEELLETSRKWPDTVVCTWGHGIVPDESGDVFSAHKWQYLKEGYEPSYLVIPTGIGGVLYPPHVLDEEVFNTEALTGLCLNADDLWLKAMALLNDKKAVRVNKPARVFFTILETQNSGLYYDNALEDKNSVAWRNIMEAYPKCRELLRREFENATFG